MMPVDDNNRSWCKGAAEDAQVATVPDTAFGTPEHARIPFTTNRRKIREGFDRLHEFGNVQS